MGDFGPAADQFLQFLKDTNQTIWQVLPLTPVGYGNSPYTSYSAFAGNLYLISPEILRQKGLLSREELNESELEISTKTDFTAAYQVRTKLLRTASERFYADLDRGHEQKMEKFILENKSWLPDYTLFNVISLENDRKPWNKWHEKLAKRDKPALKRKKQELAPEIGFQNWIQFEFHNQWLELKRKANEFGIRVVGDIPIFVDHNSADVWANPGYFSVDEKGNRELVAGVPPDYFSETGQLWGNPVYRWEKLKKDGYRWWVERFRQMFHLFDAIRVDHFRGFESYWAVSAKEKNAIKGDWLKGPGADLFHTIQKQLGELPIIAEDLGFVTPEVEELRDRFRFPGMKILHFAFDSGTDNIFLPHNYLPNSVVYSGTHDNDTTRGWYQLASEYEKDLMRKYARSDGSEPHWDQIRLGMLSVSDQAVFPLQDYMGLGSECRMNTPGTVGNNWGWRYTPEMLDNIDRDRIRELIFLGNRFRKTTNYKTNYQ